MFYRSVNIWKRNGWSQGNIQDFDVKRYKLPRAHWNSVVINLSSFSVIRSWAGRGRVRKGTKHNTPQIGMSVHIFSPPFWITIRYKVVSCFYLVGTHDIYPCQFFFCFISQIHHGMVASDNLRKLFVTRFFFRS